MIAFLLTMQVVSVSNFETGATLYARCTSSKAEDEAICTAYITGVADVVSTGQSTKTLPPLVCTPDGTTIDKYKDAVVAYLKANPDDRSLAASGQVIGALSEAFPCKTRS